MNGSARILLAGLAAALIVGAVLALTGPRAGDRPIVLSGEAMFPDHSQGHEPGVDSANRVRITVSLVTVAPWIQGSRHELLAAIDAEPGSGVSSVELTTLRLYLERPAGPRRDIINGDLDLLKPAGPNRWVPTDGPLVIFPNQDVTGTGFFLSFALSLNVWYSNGASYGWGGWDPRVRILSPDIVADFAPLGIGLLAGGGICAILLAATWTFDRRSATVAR